jgi:hypothetical protein
MYPAYCFTEAAIGFVSKSYFLNLAYAQIMNVTKLCNENKFLCTLLQEVVESKTETKKRITHFIFQSVDLKSEVFFLLTY